MEDADLTDGGHLSNKMEINLHMLGALMLNGVGGEVHSADVVAVDKNAWRWHSTRPPHWNGRRLSGAWLTRTPGCLPGTPHSLM
jgi:hypothetical protein